MTPRTTTEVIEHKVQPWLQILTPVLLGLILFILSNLNTNLLGVQNSIIDIKDRMAGNEANIRANETAITIYHNNFSEELLP